MEKIYTIPVNEAFDTAVEKGGCTCPLCLLYDKLEENELDLILGASMMEPDVRIKTNEMGFCGRHYDRMFHMKNRLGLALMMESHLAELAKDLKPSLLSSLTGDKGGKTKKRMEKLEEECYVCSRIDFQFSRMIETVVYLYGTEEAFRKKTRSVPVFCLPHAKRLLTVGQMKLQKKSYPAFFDDIWGIVSGYLAEVSGDVSWFCKKFDYQHQDEPWGNSKDAVERTIRFLTGTER